MNKITQSKFLTDEEFNRLMSKLVQHRGKRDSILLRLALFTGARSIELLRILRKDVTDGAVTIRGAKGSNDRTIPLNPEFFEELVGYASKLQPSDRLFSITERRFRKIWDKWRPVKKGGHCLRHTFGVRLYRSCRDIHLVKNALGHVNIQNTMVYLDFVQGQEALGPAILGAFAA